MYVLNPPCSVAGFVSSLLSQEEIHQTVKIRPKTSQFEGMGGFLFVKSILIPPQRLSRKDSLFSKSSIWMEN